MKIVLKDEILSLRHKGLTYKEIREKLQCTMSVISYHCRRAGLSFSIDKSKPSPTEEQIGEINRLYREGKTYKEIMSKIGFSKFTLSKYIREKKKRVVSITKSQSVVDWRKRTKQKLIDYKGGECEKCGYKKCIEVLQFHHLDPTQKDFTIAGKSWAFERLKKEVDKCILLCANCHIEAHNIKL